MPRPFQNFDVQLKYTSATETWGISRDGNNWSSPQSFPAIKVDYGYQGQITFTIVQSPGVTFAQSSPFLVGPKGSGTTKPTGVDPQFTATPGANGTSLVVQDLNGVPNQPQKAYGGGDFTYVLNFANAKQIDPVITNTGCCKPTGGVRDFLAANALLLTAVVLLLIVAWVFVRNRKAPAPDSDAD